MVKNGFTLMEMLAVVLVLAIIALITVPLINKQFRDSTNTLYNAQLDNIKEGAKNWAGDHLDQIPSTENGAVSVTLKDLQDQGYIKKKLENPKTKKPFEPTISVQIVYIGGNYTYRVVGENLVKYPNKGTKGWRVSTNPSLGGGIVEGSTYAKGDISGFKIKVINQSTSWVYALAQLDIKLFEKNTTYIVEFDIISNKGFTMGVHIMKADATERCANVVNVPVEANQTNHVKVELTTFSNVPFVEQGLYLLGINQTGGEYVIYNEKIYKK